MLVLASVELFLEQTPTFFSVQTRIGESTFEQVRLALLYFTSGGNLQQAAYVRTLDG